MLHALTISAKSLFCHASSTCKHPLIQDGGLLAGPAMDALTALKLQLEWGADEALAEEPLDRFIQRAERPVTAKPGPVPRSPAAPSGTPASRAAALAGNCST